EFPMRSTCGEEFSIPFSGSAHCTDTVWRTLPILIKTWNWDVRCRRATDKQTDDEQTRDGHAPNENKMSDGGRERAPLGVEMWKSSQKWSVQRSAVRSIAWLDADVAITVRARMFHTTFRDP